MSDLLSSMTVFDIDQTIAFEMEFIGNSMKVITVGESGAVVWVADGHSDNGLEGQKDDTFSICNNRDQWAWMIEKFKFDIFHSPTGLIFSRGPSGTAAARSIGRAVAECYLMTMGYGDKSAATQ